MNANEIISSGLLELYAAGLASETDAAQVELWIQQYPEVAAEFETIQLATEALAMANAVEPGATVKGAVFATINAKKQAPVIALKNNKPTTAYWKWAAAAAVLLLIGSAAVNVSLYNKYDEANNNLQQTKQQLDFALQNNNDMQQDMHIVQSKYSEPIALHGVTAAPGAAAKIFWMKNTGDVYVDPSNLPDIPQGKQFQLWAIVDGKPVDAGMIITSTKGNKYRIQKMKSFGQAQAFAITIEKNGGSPTPTMDQMVVMGKM